MEEEAEIEEEDVELFDHDPKFWQQPSRWVPYFFHDQGGGSIFIGASKYFATMAWKLYMLVRLTVGIWDEETTANQQIKKRAQQLDIDVTDDDERHQDMLTAVGEGHSLVWQFIPYCVFISKAGEAFNVHPIFVYDKTIESAITIAKEQEARYKEWYTEKMGKTAMPKGWVEVVSIASGRIHYLHVESGHTSYVTAGLEQEDFSGGKRLAKRRKKKSDARKRRQGDGGREEGCRRRPGCCWLLVCFRGVCSNNIRLDGQVRGVLCANGSFASVHGHC